MLKSCQYSTIWYIHVYKGLKDPLYYIYNTHNCTLYFTDTHMQVGGQQGVTEFRGAAFSELRVPVVGLEGVVKFTCVAEAVGLTEQASLVLTAFCKCCVY